MYISTRRVGETIHLGCDQFGNDIVIKVLPGTGRNLRIGIDAPKDITITTGEAKRAIEKSTALN